MMNLNKKGFTLIELLAVVVILLAISVIAISSISAAIERNKNSQNKAKEDIIVSYAKIYYQEHKNSLGATGYIKLDKLELSDSEKEYADGDVIDGCVHYSNNGTQFEFLKSEQCPELR